MQLDSNKTPAPETHKQVTVAYAYCCSGPTCYCDCVKKDHGTALMGANEPGDDYIVVSRQPASEGSDNG